MHNQIIFYAFSSQSWDCYFPIITELIKQKPDSEQWMGVYAPCNQYNFRNESSKLIFDRLKQNFKHPRDTKKKKTKRGKKKAQNKEEDKTTEEKRGRKKVKKK